MPDKFINPMEGKKKKTKKSSNPNQDDESSEESAASGESDKAEELENDKSKQITEEQKRRKRLEAEKAKVFGKSKKTLIIAPVGPKRSKGRQKSRTVTPSFRIDLPKESTMTPQDLQEKRRLKIVPGSSKPQPSVEPKPIAVDKAKGKTARTKSTEEPDEAIDGMYITKSGTIIMQGVDMSAFDEPKPEAMEIIPEKAQATGIRGWLQGKKAPPPPVALDGRKSMAAPPAVSGGRSSMVAPAAASGGRSSMVAPAAASGGRTSMAGPPAVSGGRSSMMTPAAASGGRTSMVTPAPATTRPPSLDGRKSVFATPVPGGRRSMMPPDAESGPPPARQSILKAPPLHHGAARTSVLSDESTVSGRQVGSKSISPQARASILVDAAAKSAERKHSDKDGATTSSEAVKDQEGKKKEGRASQGKRDSGLSSTGPSDGKDDVGSAGSGQNIGGLKAKREGKLSTDSKPADSNTKREGRPSAGSRGSGPNDAETEGEPSEENEKKDDDEWTKFFNLYDKEEHEGEEEGEDEGEGEEEEQEESDEDSDEEHSYDEELYSSYEDFLEKTGGKKVKKPKKKPKVEKESKVTKPPPEAPPPAPPPVEEETVDKISNDSEADLIKEPHPPERTEFTVFNRVVLKWTVIFIAFANFLYSIFTTWQFVMNAALHQYLLSLNSINCPDTDDWIVITVNIFWVFASCALLFAENEESSQICLFFVAVKLTQMLTFLYVRIVQLMLLSIEEHIFEICWTVVVTIFDIASLSIVIMQYYRLTNNYPVRHRMYKARGAAYLNREIWFAGEQEFFQSKHAYRWVCRNQTLKIVEKIEKLRTNYKRPNKNYRFSEADFELNFPEGYDEYRRSYNIKTDVFNARNKLDFGRFRDDAELEKAAKVNIDDDAPVVEEE